jgi:G3E family GTPase
MAPEQRTPVALLTGFLGSGKTTLLNRLLKRPELANTAVIINEWGAIGIDHLLVESAREPVLLENGCLCCNALGDLARALDGLRRRRVRGEIAFDRVVIETTGLAAPAPILASLTADPEIAGTYVLDGTVATIDAACGAATLDRHEEARRQAAVADRLIVTKTDIAEAWGDLLARLRTLNPAAPIDRAREIEPGLAHLFCGRSVDPQRWLDATAYDSGDRHAHTHAEGHGDGRIQSFVLTREQPMSGDAFKLWLSVLAGLCGERLLRVKGFVAVSEGPDRPFLIQGVQHVFEPPVRLAAWPSDDRRTRLVFITEGLSRELIAQTLEVWEDFGV